MTDAQSFPASYLPSGEPLGEATALDGLARDWLRSFGPLPLTFLGATESVGGLGDLAALSLPETGETADSGGERERLEVKGTERGVQAEGGLRPRRGRAGEAPSAPVEGRRETPPRVLHWPERRRDGG